VFGRSESLYMHVGGGLGGAEEVDMQVEVNIWDQRVRRCIHWVRDHPGDPSFSVLQTSHPSPRHSLARIRRSSPSSGGQ